MKILIGTPVHESKDYSIGRWIESVSKFTRKCDLLLADNTPGTKYVDKLHGYCKSAKIKKYDIVHVELDENAEPDERIARSREEIRSWIIASNYAAWCTVECDIIAPPDSIEILEKLINGFDAVNHGYPSRINPNELMIGFGLSLIKKEALVNNGFLLQFGKCDPLMPNCWHGSEYYFMRRLVRQGLSYIDVYGLIKPIEHLEA